MMSRCEILTEISKQSLLDRLKQLLNENDVEYKEEDTGIAFVANDSEGYDVTIRAQMNEKGSWLYLFVFVGNLSEVESHNKERVYQGLLKMNLEISGAKVAMDSDEDFVIIGESNDMDLTYNEFHGIVENVIEAAILTHKALEQF
ncbi:MAG: hypothetical protein GF411_15710 [Candidatus Lokiarchaeota archaeon]|nr:hypothetical protein [Candidatus Lokiarchaeota archaeon]